MAVPIIREDPLLAIPSAEEVMDSPFVFDSEVAWHKPILLHIRRPSQAQIGQRYTLTSFTFPLNPDLNPNPKLK